MIIAVDTPVIIKDRISYIRGLRGKRVLGRRGWVRVCGDIPVARLNEITGKLEEVENRRGIAYATRRDIRFRSKPRQNSEVDE